MKMLAQNYRLLERKFPILVKAMQEVEEQCVAKPVHVVPSKSGVPTLYLEGIERPIYIHSQYDPIREAEGLVSQHEDVEDYDYILFYGVGLGYHVEAFMSKYPNKTVILYETNIPFFYHLLNSRTLEQLDLKNIQNIYLEADPNDIDHHMLSFIENLNGKLLVITLPVYERLFSDRTKFFLSRLKVIISHHTNTLQTNEVYEKLWTYNGGANFQSVLESPSILRDLKNVFVGKPVILVSAGPSLSEELDNLVQIKRDKTAYIFAVGSANKALISYGIYPDAVCSYDPITYNHVVFEDIIQQQIQSIPLIYGSSVGYETIRQYPGPKIHVVTGQDTAAFHYLNGKQLLDDGELVGDQPSIAVIMAEVLCRLGIGELILVGQNLALRNKQYYSKGIHYEARPNQLTEEDNLRAIETDCVDGGKVLTFPELSLMRRALENIFNHHPNIKVINTTMGGAAIAGTQFIPLQHLMQQKLLNQIVKPKWYQIEYDGYDLQYANDRQVNMGKEHLKLTKDLQAIIRKMRQMEALMKVNNRIRLLKMFPEFDKLFNRIFHNTFYKVYIQPMARIYYDGFNRSAGEIKEIHDPIIKTKKVLDVFGRYMYQCHTLLSLAEEVMNNVHQAIDTMMLRKEIAE
ncbi:motility associated factor glycosyltransferase family protein [Cohnella silvisoli]|uniref:DUF115 domain-containing protein n=1 Tax=Cohnella silvisoli TaxID=2873699 RepID=A0ABV1KPJ9_9BACL|nr:6-hydroxymethylpterin diphosphokinase MptE-like protein [Cohnella silvisoli]MCD9022311.1 DUF115 domain-containing protein [Cohnella silvisoli]